MTEKDIEITIIALLKSTIESQAPRDQWKESLDLAISIFRGARGEWPGDEPFSAPSSSEGGASSAPRSAPSGDPSPAAPSGLPVYVVINAPPRAMTNQDPPKPYRTLTLRNDQGDEQKVGFFESKYETFEHVAAVNVGDQITAIIEVRGDYVNGNKLRVVKRATTNNNW